MGAKHCGQSRECRHLRGLKKADCSFQGGRRFRVPKQALRKCATAVRFALRRRRRASGRSRALRRHGTSRMNGVSARRLQGTRSACTRAVFRHSIGPLFLSRPRKRTATTHPFDALGATPLLTPLRFGDGAMVRASRSYMRSGHLTYNSYLPPPALTIPPPPPPPPPPRRLPR